MITWNYCMKKKKLYKKGSKMELFVCRCIKAWTSSQTKWQQRNKPSVPTTCWVYWIHWAPTTLLWTSETWLCLLYPSSMCLINSNTSLFPHFFWFSRSLTTLKNLQIEEAKVCLSVCLWPLQAISWKLLNLKSSSSNLVRWLLQTWACNTC